MVARAFVFSCNPRCNTAVGAGTHSLLRDCCSVCCCTGAILQFVRDTTTRVEGVGDVCSLALFDFDRHGNRKYGAPAHANKRMRSKQVSCRSCCTECLLLSQSGVL